MKYIRLINEFQRKDIDFIKEIGSVFTIAIEYEICANEDPDEEPPITDYDDVIHHIKEKTLLDMNRGKIVSYQSTFKRDFDNKKIEKFIDDTLSNVFLFLDAEIK